MSSCGLFTSWIPTRNLYAFLFCPAGFTCPEHHIFLGLIILFGEEYKLRIGLIILFGEEYKLRIGLIILFGE
jgi:hypothetical protein